MEHALGSDALFYRPELTEELVTVQEVIGDEVIPERLFFV